MVFSEWVEGSGVMLGARGLNWCRCLRDRDLFSTITQNFELEADDMDIECGNLSTLDTNGTGWFLGFSDWAKTTVEGTSDLRFMAKTDLARTLHAKWMVHPVNDDRGRVKPPSEGRSISILVSESGHFRLEFCGNQDFAAVATRQHILQQHGDFVIWGENIYHRWFVEATCTILTLRWVPV